MCTALQLGGDVEQPWHMSKYDVIHKTTPPEEDLATAIGNMREMGEDRTCSSEDMIADRTHRETDRQTRSSQYSALPYRRRSNKLTNVVTYMSATHDDSRCDCESELSSRRAIL